MAPESGLVCLADIEYPCAVCMFVDIVVVDGGSICVCMYVHIISGFMDVSLLPRVSIYISSWQVDNSHQRCVIVLSTAHAGARLDERNVNRDDRIRLCISHNQLAKNNLSQNVNVTKKGN